MRTSAKRRNIETKRFLISFCNYCTLVHLWRSLIIITVCDGIFSDHFIANFMLYVLLKGILVNIFAKKGWFTSSSAAWFCVLCSVNSCHSVFCSVNSVDFTTQTVYHVSHRTIIVTVLQPICHVSKVIIGIRGSSMGQRQLKTVSYYTT